MTPWLMLILTLLGINLVRLTRRSAVVAAVLIAAPAGMVGLGWLQDIGWWWFGGSAVMLIAVVMAWRGLTLRAGRGRQAWGLVVFAAGCTAQAAILGPAAPVPGGGWPWLAAFLVLAEPSTRLLRWGMGLMGRPPASASEAYGRGEAIGVLERWLALVMIVRGDYSALAFIIAAKALARHRRFEQDPEFAEYFLVGTLASLLLAVAAAEAVRGWP